MIEPFKLDPEVVSVYRTAQSVRLVVQRMGDSKDNNVFTYHGKNEVGGIAEHRIREVQEFGNLGTTYTNAVWYFSHHTTEAISEPLTKALTIAKPVIPLGEVKVAIHWSVRLS